MNRKSILLTILLCVASWAMASPVTGLLERIDKGASKKFIIEQVKSMPTSLNSTRKVIKSLFVEITM